MKIKSRVVLHFWLHYLIYTQNFLDVLQSFCSRLLVWDAADGVLTRQIAIVQLKVMAPCVMLAALIGISFGSLSADGIYGVPSLSPALSSMAILVGVSVLG
jgi:peptidoglycan biosynthesis protein MviN/MurJ (putative lipid II flippase)